MFIPLIFVLAFILFLVNFFSELYGEKLEKHHSKLLSFSSGIFITYIFLYIFPEFFIGKQHLGNPIFALLLIGFIVFHLAEKYLYQHIKNKDILLQDLGELHVAGFFIDHFVVGIALFLSIKILLIY
jgi:hypothetical protein